MADTAKPEFHIILLPRQDYWKWVDAVRDFALTFGAAVTPSPQQALDFHSPEQTVSVISAPGAYPHYGDIATWFAQHSPDVRLDVISATTPGDLHAALAQRVASGRSVGEGSSPQHSQPPQPVFSLYWPTDYPTIVQGFSENPELYLRWGLPGHDGIDIKAPINSNVYACADGAVSRVHDGSGNHPYGIHIRIVHQGGYHTIYGHLNQALVSSGQVVKAGDVIGLADGTGNSTGNVLHLALKKEGATAAGLTPFPNDIIDPTPYLRAPVLLASPQISDTGWVYDHCLVGLSARPDGEMTGPDWAVIRDARIEALKITGSTPLTVVQQAFGANPRMFVMANLTTDFRGRIIAPQEFARRVENEAQALFDHGVEYFEIHAQPNVAIQGLGTSWRDGYEFGQWFLEVIGHLRPKLPQAKFGWPGLSSGGRVEGMRADARLFVEQAASMISQADWIGCHCYWRDSSEMLSVSGGLGYKQFRDEWPSTLLMITEFCNTSPDTLAEEKGRQYAAYYQLLIGQAGIGAAFASIVSAANGYNSEVWRTEDGNLTPIVSEVRGRKI